MEESLLDQAKEVKVTPFEMSRLGREIGSQEVPAIIDETLLNKVAFADVEDMTQLMNNFGLQAEDLLDEKISGKLQFVYGESQRSGMPLQEFLARIINRTGGRLQDNLLDRANQFLTLLASERATSEKLMEIRHNLVNIVNENRNSLQR